MDVQKYKAISKELSDDLDALAKKYDLSNYSFIGFIGEPKKNHTPICLFSVVKQEFVSHLHIQFAKMVFLKAAKNIAEIGGGVFDITEVI